jgi:hypothetical protein
MFSNGSRARRGAASKQDNRQLTGRASRATSIHMADTDDTVPPFGLIEGGFRRL